MGGWWVAPGLACSSVALQRWSLDYGGENAKRRKVFFHRSHPWPPFAAYALLEGDDTSPTWPCGEIGRAFFLSKSMGTVPCHKVATGCDEAFLRR